VSPARLALLVYNREVIEPSGSSDVTRLLAAAAGGDAEAMPRVAELAYQELRRIAHAALQRDRAPTLSTTALVHEAYLRLVEPTAGYESRGHFLAVAARAMRSIVVDHARARGALKRGGARQRVALDEVLDALAEQDVDVVEFDGALERLFGIDERRARVVELRFFGGLDIEQTARVLGIGHATVERDWQFARAWLRRELEESAGR